MRRRFGATVLTACAGFGAHASYPATLATQPPASVPAPAQDATAAWPDGHIRVSRQPDDVRVRVDGKLGEAVWRELRVLGDFRVIDPDTLAPAGLATEVRVFYTGRGFYLGVEMTQPPDTLVEYLSGRDQWLTRDAFSFTLDTSGEGRYGFWFSLALGDSKADGTVLPERQYSNSWDGAWRGATARTATGWSAEYFIPWALVSMPKMAGARTMGIYAQRQVAHIDERHAWPPLPWTKPKFLSAFATLALRDLSPRQQYSATPYVASTHHFLDGETERPRAGVDLFWRPSSNFQLTTTLNPDFGNVEADDVVINLSSYETFFPEKRLFFQEGQEIFSIGGKSDATLLHTRRIGAPPVRPSAPADVRLDNDDLHRPATLLGAVKATGQHGRVRYGFLGVLEDDARFDGWAGEERLVLRQEGRDFGAARLLYERSADGYAALGLLSTAMRHPTRRANVNAVDGQYHTPGGELRIASQFIASDVTGRAEDGQGGWLSVNYLPRQGLSHSFRVNAFDDSIALNDMGFLSRNDYRSAHYQLRMSTANAERVRDMRTYLRLARMWNTAGKVIGAGVSVDQSVTLKSFAQVRFSLAHSPSHYDDRGSFGNGTFRVSDQWDAELRYSSDSSRRVAYEVRQRWQQEALRGARHRTEGRVRWRPTDRLTVALGLRYANRDAWLLHQSAGTFATFAARQLDSNMDLSFFFSARQQVTVGFQWVGVKAQERDFYRLVAGGRLQADQDPLPVDRGFNISRMNMQLRYHWELAPLSDMFVVYTRDAALPRSASRQRSFSEVFADTWREPVGEHLALKFRYRFGS